ncbi:MAG: hypothetical protein M3209_09485 [Acidobacteriota bacterium]|nr:hypothetical protein [Acidobacteriota bacterium]
MIYKLIVLIKFIYRSLTKINRAHIGRIADYRGEKVELRNGVGHPKWSVISLKTGETYERIHVLDLQLDDSLLSKYKAFKFHFRWLITNHFKSEVTRLKYPHLFELMRSK